MHAVFQDAYARRSRLGKRIAEEVEKTSLGKRQSRLEKMVADMLPEALQRTGLKDFRLEVEGNPPVVVGTPEVQIFVDPVDGTANTARGIETGVREIISDVAMVVAIAPEKEDLRFGDFILGAGLDWRSGQEWIAIVGDGAYTASYGTPYVLKARLSPAKNYHRHNPLLACEFYRHANWATRLLVNQAVEWSDTASSFMNILRVPLGEVDCFFNNVVPGISREGQRGHELGAIMPFLREIQGYAVNTRTGWPLARTLFTFDGMTPVIIGVDQDTVLYYQGIIEKNLNRLMPGSPQFTTVSELVRVLHSLVGTEPWTLRPLG